MITACKNCVHIYLHLITTVMFKKNKRIRRESHNREPRAQTCFFYMDITFENFQENHVRKQIKPTRDHHELFFCVTSPADNSCVESKARRNNKNLCISKSLIFTQYL